MQLSSIETREQAEEFLLMVKPGGLHDQSVYAGVRQAGSQQQEGTA
jgi:hypothetical protein